MNIFNIKVPKDEISMIFDPIRDAENYSTSLYLHKSKIAFDEENNIYTAHVEIDSNKNSRTDKLVKQIINCDYGTFLTTILNADFSTAEKAYYSFFVYYGIEGTTSVSLLNETNPTLLYYKIYIYDGSPSCKSFASRKAYDERVTEDIAKLTYKREYQRRITQVYRAVSDQKEETRANFKIWKSKARVRSL
jgi:hypothetical protein